MDLKSLASGIKQQVSDASGEAGNGSLQAFVQSGINIAFILIGIAAVIVIVLGGINYATSQGDPGKIGKGKKMLITGLVGLLIAIMAFAIVNFVLEAMKKQ